MTLQQIHYGQVNLNYKRLLFIRNRFKGREFLDRKLLHSGSRYFKVT